MEHAHPLATELTVSLESPSVSVLPMSLDSHSCVLLSPRLLAVMPGTTRGMFEWLDWKTKIGLGIVWKYSRSLVMRMGMCVESGLELGENKEIDRKQEGSWQVVLCRTVGASDWHLPGRGDWG